MKKRFLSLLLVVMVLLSAAPFTAFAADADVPATAVSAEEEAGVDGIGDVPGTAIIGEAYVNVDALMSGSATLTDIASGTDISTATDLVFSGYVNMYASDSAADVVVRFIKAEQKTVNVNEGTGAINGIGGLSAGDYGDASGWMVLLNDWFVDADLASYTVANKGLAPGDELSVGYTLDDGADLGYNAAATDKTLESLFLTTSATTTDVLVGTGTDVRAFSAELPNGGETVQVVPTANEKAFAITLTDADGNTKRNNAMDQAMYVESGDTVSVTVDGTETYEITFTGSGNKAPKLKGDASYATTTDVNNNLYIDVTSYFEDEDGDPLTYSVRNRDGITTAVDTPANFVFNSSTTGIFPLVFTASDGKATSPEFTYTVRVNATIVATDKYYLGDPATVTMNAYSTAPVEVNIRRDKNTASQLHQFNVVLEAYAAAGKTPSKTAVANVEKLNKLIEVNVVDDDTISIGVSATSTDIVKDLKALKGSYKLNIQLQVNGATEKTVEGALTLKVSKSVPKVKATALKFNSFIPLANQTVQPLVYTGITGDVTIALNDTDKNKPKNEKVQDWLEVVEEDGSIVGFKFINNTKLKNSGTLYLVATSPDWTRAGYKEFAFTLKVSSASTQAAVKMKSTSAPVYMNYDYYTGTPLALVAKSKNVNIYDTGVTDVAVDTSSTLPTNYKNSLYEVQADSYSPYSGTFVLQPKGYGTTTAVTPVAGKVRLLVTTVSGGTQTLDVSVKLTKETTMPKLKASKASFTLNPNLLGGESYDVTITNTIPGFKMSDAAGSFLTATSSDIDNVKAEVLNDNTIRVSVDKGAKAATYKVVVGLKDDVTTDLGKFKSINLTVKVAKSTVNTSVKFTAKGSVNLTTGAQATVTAKFGNYLGTYATAPTFKVESNKKADEADYTSKFSFTYNADNTWTLGQASATDLIVPGTYKVTATGGTLAGGDTAPVAKTFTFKVAATKPKLTQSTKAVTLYRNDETYYAPVEIALNGNYAADIDWGRVEIKEAKGTELYKLDDNKGDGKVEIGFKDGVDTANAKKAITLTLNIYIEGNNNIAGTVKVKVTPKL